MGSGFSIPDNHVFSFVVLTNATKVPDFASPIELGSEFCVLCNPHNDIGIDWVPWVGHERSRQIATSNFALGIVREISNPDPLYQHLHKLQVELHMLLSAIFLQGFPDYGKGFFITGAKYGGDLYNVSSSDRILERKNPYVFAKPLNVDQIRQAIGMLPAIKSVYQSDDTFRLRRGFGAWRIATEEKFGDERLHQCIRSLEALVPPDKGCNANGFANHCELFTGRSGTSHRLLQDLYRIRNHTEHMIEIAEVFFADRPERDRKRLVWQRVVQAELLTSNVYTKIFSEPLLFEQFGTDSQRKLFWLAAKKTPTLWRNQINLLEVLDENFDFPSSFDLESTQY